MTDRTDSTTNVRVPDGEEIPSEPPWPGIKIHVEDPDVRKQVAEGTLIGTYFTGDLIISASRLADLAEQFKGRFEEGMEIPQSGKAAAAGAIAISCAALEAALNDILLTADLIDSDYGPQPETRLIRLSLGLPIDRRLEALAAVAGKLVDWSREPFRALRLLLSVRKHLLHHEGGLIIASQGFWPARKLRQVATHLKSPYPIDDAIPLPWHVHVLTPRGARWAVEVVDSILDYLNEVKDTIEQRVQQRIDGNADITQG